MAKVEIKVLTTTGYDTKYAFPGATPHLDSGALTNSGGQGGTYNLAILRNGQSLPQKGYYYGYETFGTDFMAPADRDLSGVFRSWAVADYYVPAMPDLLSVHFRTDDDQFYSTLKIGSFSTLSLDDAVSLLLSSGDTARPILTGNIGNDTLRGSFTHDELDGGKGADSMLGGDGDDQYTVDNKGDKVVESSGNGDDTVRTKLSYTLGANVEGLVGTGTGDTTLIGNSAKNGISGTVGDNTIKGLAGADTLGGGDGKDALYGGTGKDFFFFYTPPSSSNVDTIKDFKHHYDFITLFQSAHAGLVASPVTPLTMLTKAAFYASKSGQAHDGNDRVLYDSDDGRLYFDRDGDGNAYSRKLIAILTDHPTVTHDDILII